MISNAARPATAVQAARPRAWGGRQRGFSVLELVIALSLLALATGGIYTMITVGHRATRSTNDFLHSQAQLRAALDNALDEARWAQSVTAASATAVTLLVPQATPFSAASPYTVTFAYDAAGDTFTRQEDPDAGGAQPALPADNLAFSVIRLDGTDGVSFEYFDATGTPLGAAPAVLADVVRIRLTVTVTRNGVSRTLSGDVALRGR
jgi:prepilin-type N-terminal cleavage/methylation domain-containing protein